MELKFWGVRGSIPAPGAHTLAVGGNTADDAIVELARGSSVLVHEGQCTTEEKRGPKAGWGHSAWEEAALTAKEAKVELLYISHHDPERSDSELIQILSRARRIFPETEIATESTVCEFPACGSIAPQ